MKIRQIIDSVVGKGTQHKSGPDSDQRAVRNIDSDHAAFTMDMLGQGLGRLICPLFTSKGGYTEKYEIALEVIETYKQINDYRRQMQFWDEHSTVFGSACIMVADTHEKEYWPYYGRPYTSRKNDLGEPEGRYIVASIFPSNLDDFRLFSEWCSQKYYHFYHGPIFDESSYWKNIGGNLFEDEYLINNLKRLEEERNSVDRLPTLWGVDLCTDELAKKYFFFYGNHDASKGKDSYLSDDLYSILKKVLTGPLSLYGNVISQYDHGYNTATMVAFLKKQKKRLDNGENVRVPAITSTNGTQENSIERDLQIEGITIKGGWIQSDQVDPKMESTDTAQVEVDLGQLIEGSPTTPNASAHLNCDFSDLFNTESDAHICLNLLKSFNLIGNDGKHRIGKRDKGRLMAFVEALQQKHLLPPARTTSELTSIIAKQIGLDYKRPRKEYLKNYENSLRSYLSKLNAISIRDLTWSMVDDNGR